jgi:hypothetical protein
MRCRKNDFPVRDPAVGDFLSTYWLGDLWECPGCGTQIVTGFGMSLGNLSAASPLLEEGVALEFQYELPTATAPEGGAQ